MKSSGEGTTRALSVLTCGLVVAAIVATASAVPAVVATDPFPAAAGTTFAAIVVDRETGDPVVEHNPHRQFRSASLVKLLIALDYFHRLGPDAEVPERDGELLASMLRSSDDPAASVLWVQQGWETIVERAVALLGLQDTEPPANRGIWGDTATSAADVVRVYRYLLEQADPRARGFILGNLREATRCAVDGRDQHFGIPRTVPEPWAIKQGWSGFGEVPPGQECTPTPPSVVEPERDVESHKDPAGQPASTPTEPGVDLAGEVMHTTGTIGDDHGTIMVVLSMHPDGTPYEAAALRVADVAGALQSAIGRS